MQTVVDALWDPWIGGHPEEWTVLATMETAMKCHVGQASVSNWGYGLGRWSVSWVLWRATVECLYIKIRKWGRLVLV